MLRFLGTATALQLVGLVTSTIDRIVIGGLLLRLWGVAVFEDWSVLFAAAALLGLLDFGLYMTLGNGLNEAFQKKQMTLFARRVSSALFIKAAISAVGFLLVVAWTLGLA
jgi:hypothetical protein